MFIMGTDGNHEHSAPAGEEKKLTITAEEINQLPLRYFEGKISVISDASKLPKIISEARKHQVIGFDTETRPSFKKGQFFSVSLLQLAFDNKAYLIRINHTGVTEEIATLFETPGVVKVGVGIRDDIKALQKIRPFVPHDCIDLSILAKQSGLQVESVKKLCALLLGFRISKTAQTSNWEAPTLTQKQIEYAATDAWVCLKLYEKMIG